MRLARSCCDHLAGRLGVAMPMRSSAASLPNSDDGIGRVSGEGRRFLAGLGIDIDALAGGKHPLCQTGIDRTIDLD